MELPTLHCLRCSHDWIARVKEIKTCPKCRSPYWDRPRKKNENSGQAGIKDHI